MELSSRTRWAVEQMRYFQEEEERYRASAQHEYELAKQSLTRAYQRTNRETLGNLDKTINRRALEDQTRKDRIGDEQLCRGLAEMYAAIAQVELALDEARERERQNKNRSPANQQGYGLRDVSPPRIERTVG